MERRKREHRREERKRAATRQAYLETKICAACPVDTRRNYRGCESCPVFNEIKAIGKRFDKITADAIEIPEVLTFSVYLRLSERGWSDTKIARTYGIANSTFWEFKNSHSEVKGIC